MEVPMYFPFRDSYGQDFVLSTDLRDRYTALTLGAQAAKAYPSQSGYHVRTHILAQDGTRWLGGNKEHALSDAYVHGETATISALKDLTDSPLEALAWSLRLPEDRVDVAAHDFGCPCGACLDVLMANCALQMVLLNGNETGVVYTQLRDFLFDDYKRGNSSQLVNKEVQRALLAADRGNDVYLPQEKKPEIYGAVLVGEKGVMWTGSHYTNAGFDAIPPAMNAVLHWQNSYPSKGKIAEKHLGVKKLVIASRERMPHVLYRDRQAVLELDEILRKYRGDEQSLPVEMVYMQGKEVEVQQTTAQEWLPHPFTPGAFRMDDVILAELAKYIGLEAAKQAFA